MHKIPNLGLQRNKDHSRCHSCEESEVTAWVSNPPATFRWNNLEVWICPPLHRHFCWWCNVWGILSWHSITWPCPSVYNHSILNHLKESGEGGRAYYGKWVSFLPEDVRALMHEHWCTAQPMVHQRHNLNCNLFQACKNSHELFFNHYQVPGQSMTVY